MRRRKPALHVAAALHIACVGHVPAPATPEQIEVVRGFLLRDALA